jgi:peroxiredoxin
VAEVPGTLEGWYALHDFRSLDWERWRGIAAAERDAILSEAREYVQSAERASESGEGASALYTIVGHKADLCLLHLRPTVDQLGAVERAFNRTRLAGFTTRPYSYLSVTELSLYEAYARAGGGSEDPESLKQQPFAQRRLKPPIPDAEEMPYGCFYPMNKRRGEVLNWYAADMEERRAMMREHGATGRKYHGRVQQMITGSMGLDDWEWLVTLWAKDSLDIKKLVYEMRFDEVSAKYAEFGPFYFGMRIHADGLGAIL